MTSIVNTKLAAQKFEQLVVFTLAGEIYGVNIGKVSGIEPMQTIARLPRTPDFVEGVINLRGNVIPVADLRKVFALPPSEETKDSRIVVMNIGGQFVGCLVDSVTEVLRVDVDAIAPPSAMVKASAGTEYLLGIAKLNDKMIILLDLDSVFTESQGTELTSMEVPTTEELDAEIESTPMGYPLKGM
ncbi:chemotaxis protein CheW [Chloroflexota bacterium]